MLVNASAAAIDLNATQAAIWTRYCAKNASVTGPRMLVNVGIAQAIAEATQAATRAGCSVKTPYLIGVQDLRKPQSRPLTLNATQAAIQREYRPGAMLPPVIKCYRWRAINQAHRRLRS